MKPDHSPFIRHEQQVEFNMLAPFIQSRIRVVRLRRKGTAPLGFSIRGGCEHGTGVFISEVQNNAEAQRQGLRVGDQILRINGFNIDHAIHEEVLSLLKAKPGVVLKVKSVGMIPVKDKKKDPLTWKLVDGSGGGGGHSPADSIVDGTNSYSGSSNYEEYQEAQVTLTIIGASGIGCTIVKGPPDTPGIFVQTVKPDSLAQAAGLQVGDQIVDMNGNSFLEIEFNQAVSLMKGSRELHLSLRKAAGLDLFPEEKKTRAAAMLNGTSHTTRDARLPVLSEEEERHPTSVSNGVIIAEIVTHPPPPENHHSRQLSAATTATVSERDVSLSETNVPYTIEAGSSSSEASCSSPPSTPSLASLENGERSQAHSPDLPGVRLDKTSEKEPSSSSLRREEERLAEERRRLEAQKQRLQEEEERLAQERRELEEERRLRLSETVVAPPPPGAFVPLPPPTPPLNFLQELQQKQLTPGMPMVGADRARVRPLSMDSTKYQEEIIKRKQHEQLMQEFAKMHKKMFGGDEKPPTVEVKAPEVRTELSTFAFNRRQQVSVGPPPPPAAASMPRTLSQPNLQEQPSQADSKNSLAEVKAVEIVESPTAPTPPDPKRIQVPPSRPVLVGSTTTASSIAPSAGVTSTNPQTNGSLTSLVNGNSTTSTPAAPPTNGHPQASESPSPGRKSKDVPITDSRGPAPKPPQTYFESKPTKGPLVTIGVYPDNSRHNRFSTLSSNDGIRNRQSQFESRSSSPSTTPISVSMTSSSASSSAASSPHPPERKVTSGQQQHPATPANGNVSFKVTYNSKTNASVNSITMNKSVTEAPPKLTVSLNGKASPAKKIQTTGNGTVAKTPTVPVKDPMDLLSPEDIAGREVKTLTIPKTGPLNLKVSGGTGQPDSGGRIVVSELWEGGCVGPRVDLCKGDQILLVGQKSLVNITLTLANVILKDAMSSTKDPLKLVIARDKK